MSNSVVLIPNELSIEKVARSPFWRMRWKENDRWRSVTTKKSDQAEAESVARHEYATKQVLKEHGIEKDILNSVSDVSAIYYEGLSNKIKNGTGKASYSYYKSIVRNYIDPIAGKWSIKGVTNARIQEYEAELEKRLGRTPSKGTFNSHNIVWRNIFKIARDKKWCSADDLPEFTIKDKGLKSVARPELTLEDYVTFRRFLRDYHKSAVRYATQYKRQVLREYCIVLLATGMRPGGEPLNLKWKHITNEGKNLVIHVPEGKTGDRPVVPMNMIKPAFRRLKEITNHTEPEDYVFCMPNGSQLKDMSSMVGRALTDAGLRVNSLGETRTAYSMRHTYATFNIRYRHFAYEELADNMGTSPLMIHLHYKHVKPQDKADRLATGKTRQTFSDKKIDTIFDLMKGNISEEMREHIKAFVKDNKFDDSYIGVKAYEIEVERWERENPGQLVMDNLDYIMDAAVNRYEEFFHGDFMW